MITKDGRDTPISNLTSDNYIVPKGEERSYHAVIEVEQYDQKTGKRLSETLENQACQICRELGFDIILTGHQHIAIDSVDIEGTHGVQPPDKAGVYAAPLLR